MKKITAMVAFLFTANVVLAQEWEDACRNNDACLGKWEEVPPPPCLEEEAVTEEYVSVKLAIREIAKQEGK